MATQSVSEGEILFQSGQPMDSLQLIVSGTVKLLDNNNDKKADVIFKQHLL